MQVQYIDKNGQDMFINLEASSHVKDKSYEEPSLEEAGSQLADDSGLGKTLRDVNSPQT